MAIWELVEHGKALQQRRRPFAFATVVRCERPTSAHPGDQALITGDGQLTGWIGGSCAEPVIIREALRALQTGRSGLVRLGPPETLPAVTPDGVAVYPMTCHSGGTLEVFVDPCLPSPQAVLVGHAPVITALAALAATAGFTVIVCDPQATAAELPAARQVVASLDAGAVTLDARTYVLVATHGQDDEAVLAAALRSPAQYVALVASRRRAETCRETLLAEGLTHEQIARLRAPAGLDIGATTPEQIAVSIIAEMVQHVCAAGPIALPEAPEPIAEPLTAVDPVCGMTVELTEGTPSFAHDGQSYYFCCAGCRRQFARDPERFLATSAVGSPH